jgi:peroxiredoxin
MKSYFLLLLFAPVFAFAQTKNPVVKPDSGFMMRGNITGVADGTSVELYNSKTNELEQTTVIKNGKFTFVGKLSRPGLKELSIGSKAPYLVIFADNSDMTITGTKEGFETAAVKGSLSQDDYIAYTKLTKPYQELFEHTGHFDVTVMDKAANTLQQFINAHPKSYIAPLAIQRFYEVTNDYILLERMYNSLSAAVKEESTAANLAWLIADNKKENYGQPLADFSQADTNGKQVSLNAFKGKYVLIDFWASWCSPCRAENPNVAKVYQQYKDKNFAVLGISLDQSKAKWLEAIAQDKLTWTQLCDLNPMGNAVAQKFRIKTIPQNILIDPQGNIIGKNLRGAALEYRVSKVLK